MDGITLLVATALAAQTAPVAAPIADQAVAQQLTPERDKYKPGNVIIAFEGGIVGQDLGNVLLTLVRGNSLLPTTTHEVAAEETACSIMIDLGYPLPCSAELLETLDILNPDLRPSKGKLEIGDTLVVPNIWLRRYRTARSFANQISGERARSATIQQSWTALKLKVAPVGSSNEQVEFTGYELILGAPDESRQAAILERVMPFKSGNVRVDSIGFSAEPAAAYSITDPNVYQQQCTQQPPQPPHEIDYLSDYSDPDVDAARFVRQRPQGSENAKVFLIDVPLLPSPNLAGAIEGQAATATSQAWRCSWANGFTLQEHATHLAGIIASRPNGYGFVGVAPTATIIPFSMLQPSATSTTGLVIPPEKKVELVDRLRDNRYITTPLVYLIATSFDDYDAAVVHSGQIDPKERFKRTLEQTLVDLRPLVVVAAGQGSTGVALSPRTPMSPQNLGDQRNVLVVTACENCSRNNPTLLPTANFSESEGHYVHVAAPGGLPMLGWVSPAAVGAANGTSQAAAYVAGVAAEMMGRWPRKYAAPDDVKKRIQTTAWPIFPRTGAADDDDYTRVATGIVDPRLAFLDPSVDWVKNDDDGWRSVTIKKFSSTLLAFTSATGADVPIPARAVARVVRVSSPGAPAKFVVYTDVATRNRDMTRLGEVNRDGPLDADPDISLETCAGGTIKLSELTDLLVANSGLEGRTCG